MEIEKFNEQLHTLVPGLCTRVAAKFNPRYAKHDSLEALVLACDNPADVVMRAFPWGEPGTRESAFWAEVHCSLEDMQSSENPVQTETAFFCFGCGCKLGGLRLGFMTCKGCGASFLAYIDEDGRQTMTLV